jgi:inosose dehydratase
MAPRLASAPVTWGVWELTIGRDDLLEPRAVLGAVRELGYSGTELGPLGYLGHTPEAVGAALSEHDLELAGAFAPLHLADGALFERDLAALDPTLAILAGGDGRLVLADAGSPERRAASGQPEAMARAALDRDGFARAMERLMSAAARAREAGVFPVFHPHAGTYVETREEIERMLAASGPELGVCLDTGHALIGGAGPTDLARMIADRLAHLHVKDVDAGVHARLASGELGLDEALASGLFCPLGSGEADVAGFLAAPEVRAFEGWVVIEQDRTRVRAAELEQVIEIERRNREHVLEWAGGVPSS